jgi:chorismate mutase-like protein
MERKAVGMPVTQVDAGLAGYRRRIDAIDDRILAILGERFAVIREVAAYKEPRGIPAVIPDRVVEVRERCAARATAHGLEPDFVRALYDLMIEEACRTESRLMAAPKSRVL